MQPQVLHGDCLEVLPTFESASVHAVVTDPPYELGYMGKAWDENGIAYNRDLWRECLRVLKPGGYLLAFGASRTYHRMAVAIEDVGFEIRDSLVWIYSSGFPVSQDVSKAIDKEAGATREVVGTKKGTHHASGSGVGGMATGNKQITVSVPITAPATDLAQEWSGYGSNLKPSHEKIVCARKPVAGTIAENVRKHGAGGINIEGTRIGVRWPPNVMFSHRPECDGYCAPDCPVAALSPAQSDYFACFKYASKPSASDRPTYNGVIHETVKPVDLMRWLCRLVTPPNGTVLDPFAGSGSTLEACIQEELDAVGIELEQGYLPLIQQRLEKPVQLALDL